MKHVQLSDRQSSFIFYLVHQAKGRTEAARLAGFAAPRQSGFTLTQSPKIYEQNLAGMTPEELSAIIDRWVGEKAAIARGITPV